MSPSWIWAIGLGLLLLLVVMKRKGGVAGDKAAELLRAGAMLVDVRSAAEFSSGHLPGAVNIPLDEVERRIPELVKDRSRVILLHCQSGMRSGMAQGKLKRLGYEACWNLGSYGQAAAVVEQAKKS
jgi:phage shock protein E